MLQSKDNHYKNNPILFFSLNSPYFSLPCPEMNEQQFSQLLGQAQDGTGSVVLAAVDNEPGLVTRGGDAGGTLLHMACFGGRVDLVRSLLDRKADVNQPSNVGGDALMVASFKGHCNVIELLTSRGADIDARDNAGRTALTYASVYDNHPACLCLISKKADLMSVTNNGTSVLNIYGLNANPPLNDEVKKQHRKSLRTAWAERPHISQVRRRNWERRRAFLKFLVENRFRPLAAQHALLLAAALPPDAAIPPEVIENQQQRMALLLARVFTNDGLARLIASFL